LISACWRNGIVRSLGITVLLFVLAVVLQTHNGAYQGDFGANPDEPSHYVNGLLVRDYIGSMSFAPPMQYAEQYYLHYPKVALGHWPPVFYTFEAVWMLLFSVSRTSTMIMSAFLAAALAGTPVFLASRYVSPWIATAGGVCLVCLSLVQEIAREVSPEFMVGLFVLLASAAYAKYLETERWQHAVGFGLLVSAAGLTKGTGFVLALLPIFAIVLTRRFRLLRTTAYWIPLPIVLGLTGPWYLFAPNANHESALSTEELLMNGNTRTFFRTPAELITGFGLILSLLVLAGFVTILIQCARRKPPAALWVVMAALVPSFWIFRTFIGPARPHKNWIVLIGPCILIVCYLLSQLAGLRWGGGILRRYSTVLSAVVFLVLAACNVNALTPLTPRPMVEVAEMITHDQRFRDSVVLVASNGTAEGVLVAQVAMRESRPAHFVLRASKVLASTDWFGKTYRAQYATPEELMGYLRGVPVGLLVVDDTDRLPTELATLLSKTLQKYPEDWELVGQYSDSALSTGLVRVYRHISHEDPIHPTIRVDMRRHFGRDFTAETSE